jgi:hypoxanthine phosphoribosyltransferase
MQIHDKIFTPFLSEADIQEKVQSLAKQLNTEYAGKNVILISVLNGAFIFISDLVRHLMFQPEVQFVKVSTYGNAMNSTQKIREVWGLENLSIEGKDVLMVEDIIDTGFTADFLRAEIQQYRPASLAFVTLLFKPDAFQGQYPPEYRGFSIPTEFVVGYGLDYAQKGRELREIRVYHP